MTSAAAAATGASAALAALSSTTTVRVRDGERIVTDGPSAEIKEQLGGYSIIECADLDEALKWAAGPGRPHVPSSPGVCGN